MRDGLLFFYRLRLMLKKELLANLKDPKTRVILIFPVIFQSLIFGYVATYDLDHAPYAVLDMSRSQESRELLAHIDGSSALDKVLELQNAEQIATAMDSGDVMLTVVIPQDFSRKLNRGEPVSMQVITDGRNTMTAGMAAGYIASIVGNFNAERNPKLNLVQTETISWYNPNLITRWTFLPALVVMLGLVQVLMLGGLSVAREREQGTFDQLLVTPLSPAQILFGKAAAPILIGLLQATAVIIICRYWFQIPLAGNLLDLYLAIFIFLLSCTGLGLSISAISQTMQQVMVYCFVLLMPMTLLSGLATPVSNMAEPLQIITYANPMRFALEAVRRIYLEGAGTTDVAYNFVPMLAVAAITLPLAGWLFRNNIE